MTLSAGANCDVQSTQTKSDPLKFAKHLMPCDSSALISENRELGVAGLLVACPLQ
jgi:hypothetical protein